MRKLIVSEFVTLDGVMEAPGGEETHPHTGWVFDFFSKEQEQYKLEEVMASEALLLGRVTYEGFAAAWPQRGGEALLVAGSCTLVHSLMAHGLIDEYRLMIFPVVLGSGKRLFPETSEKTVLELDDTTTFASGVVVQTYHPSAS